MTLTGHCMSRAVHDLQQATPIRTSVSYLIQSLPRTRQAIQRTFSRDAGWRMFWQLAREGFYEQQHYRSQFLGEAA